MAFYIVEWICKKDHVGFFQEKASGHAFSAFLFILAVEEALAECRRVSAFDQICNDE